jgi:hypothetical protein
MHGLDRIPHLLGELGDLVAGICGVTASVVEEVTDIVGLEDLDQALVLAIVGVLDLVLVTGGAEAGGVRVS